MIHKVLRGSALALLSLALSSAAPITISGPGQTVPDEGSVTRTLTLDEDVDLIAVRVWLRNFSHPWIGDLAFTIEHEGSLVMLLNRPGRTSTVAGCGSSWGCSSNFVVGGVYGFRDGGANLLAIPNLSNTALNIPFADYSPVESLSEFRGMNARGDWILRISDNAGGDVNSGEWTWGLDFATPEPSLGYGVAVAAGLIAWLRRKRA